MKAGVRGSQKRRGNILFRFGLLVVMLYIIFSLIQSQIRLSENNQALAELKQAQKEQTLKNEELKQLLTSGSQEDLIERAAREKLGYVYYDEEVYTDAVGK